MNIVDAVLSFDRDPRDVRKAMLNAHSAGKLSLSDMQTLYKSTMIRAGTESGGTTKISLAEEIANLVSAQPERFSALRTAIGMFKQSYFMGEAVETIAALTQRLFKKITSGRIADNQIVETAKEEIKNKIREDYPETTFLNDIPNAIATKEGVKAIYRGESKAETEINKRPLTREDTYELGEIVTYEGVDYEVVGFDIDGEPLLDEVY
jgi:hypothetical protein